MGKLFAGIFLTALASNCWWMTFVCRLKSGEINPVVILAVVASFALALWIVTEIANHWDD